MRVGLLSTYPPQHCGIGTYTRDLVAGLRPWQPGPVPVFSELGQPETADDVAQARGTFERGRDYGSAVLEAVKAAGLDLLHVQHSSDILGADGRLPRLVRALGAMGVPTVVTLHTVHSRLSGLLGGEPGAPRFHVQLARAGARLVVHDRLGASALCRQGVPEGSVTVIPHGTLRMALPPAGESRARLGLPATGPLLLYFGFIRVVKNVHLLLFALRRLLRQVPDCRLLIVGSVQGGAWYNRAYLGLLRRLRGWLGLGDHVLIREGFVPDVEVPLLFGASDIVLMPYAQRYSSASGVVHAALGAGRPLLCSDSPKFAEIAEHVSPDLVAPTHDAAAWAARLAALIREPWRRVRMATALSAYGAETSWARVAARHVELYQAAMAAAASGR